MLGTLCLRYVAATHITSIYFEVQILLLLFQLVNPQMSPKFKHVVFCLENWAQEGKIPPVLDGLTLTHRGIYPCTGKSLSEALFFAEHGENMLCTKIVLNVRNNFCTQHVLPRFELGIFMY